MTGAVRRPTHVLIYGPPAAGKLTVAHCLSGRYGVKLLDNHLTLDVGLRLFQFGTPQLADLVERLRFELFRAAAGAGLDVVSTLVFASDDDRGHIARLVDVCDRAGATVTFVQLRPRLPVLEQRVVLPSRAGTRKVRDVATLRRLLERHDLTTPVNDDDLSIDNSDVPPEEAAAMIARRAGIVA